VQARDDLSPVSQARVIEGFAGQIIAPDQIGTRVQEACDRERTYALELLQAAGVRTRVTGSGPTDTGRAQEATKAYEDGFAEFARNMGVDAKTSRPCRNCRASRERSEVDRANTQASPIGGALSVLR